MPVYPRPRGEAEGTPERSGIFEGLSPPTRGSRLARPVVHHRPGSIPAHAGKPRQDSRWAERQEVYPRPRGEAAGPVVAVLTKGGLSPPTREAAAAGGAGSMRRGLSPPTRGSRRASGRPAAGRRSIPAHAGKPLDHGPDGRPGAVYPRPRGEASMRPDPWRRPVGLSPPTRGSLAGPLYVTVTVRSIPAHAGKPSTLQQSILILEVYPRPRGEAALPASAQQVSEGLSPPTRGSPTCPWTWWSGMGSIPAHAGKPRASKPEAGPRKVYPRPRGEALGNGTSKMTGAGLSPPTRGSLASCCAGVRGSRSIPAHAGKPGG